MTTNPMLTFYGQNKVSPINQDIRNLKSHLERRLSLYMQLGIPASCIRGHRVLEIGPGSGHNSLITASLEPHEYVLIEANETGRENIMELFSSYNIDPSLFKLDNKQLMNVSTKDFGVFDLVLCEGVLSGIRKPAVALQHLSSLVKPGGVLVITSIDAISSLAENVRRLLAYLLPIPHGTVHEQAEWLMPALEPHLMTMKAMSRLKHDWIIDNILLPLSDGYNLFSYADLVANLPENYQVLSSSPKFAQDWRWYKQIYGDGFASNDIFLQNYWSNVP